MIWCAQGFTGIEKEGALTGAPLQTLFPFTNCVDHISMQDYRWDENPTADMFFAVCLMKDFSWSVLNLQPRGGDTEEAEWCAQDPQHVRA